MNELQYLEDADRALTRLEHDPGRSELLRLVVATLHAIQSNPGATSVRRRTYQVDRQALFGVTVRSYDEDWLILWEPNSDGPLIYYIGPDL